MAANDLYEKILADHCLTVLFLLAEDLQQDKTGYISATFFVDNDQVCVIHYQVSNVR